MPGGTGAAGAGFVSMATKSPKRPVRQPYVVSVEVARYPVLHIVYDDGFSGEYDLSEMIATGPAFELLKDPEYFKRVAVAPFGRSFGRNLDAIGEEIDFCVDSVRMDIEAKRRNKITRS
jgi:hypothetical protein